jgi:HxlR-like helix-turn-helix
MGVSMKEISPCPIEAALSVIDGRWKDTILWRLLDGPMRTNELRKSIPEITERMLLRHQGFVLCFFLHRAFVFALGFVVPHVALHRVSIRILDCKLGAG